ncbi:diguanylate cyclase [Arcobacter nitrofigilis DSM 7299]|uniref:diguanylate cyclase n=1 Tax=Arcobacter nitrofigilis (strain ATCC 33309 / DSM 7299 / CCUG 15893 / LMG 7604 / NCTC 12251 / CI) TaxID=572480 RepID=D5V1K8_ARCNC|nr:diguanylate cyclase [Arcobacter nitrofigilis]ADG93442.1 diguanylate cyclase [Arcobacter nitrofigilis DSM 7299]
MKKRIFDSVSFKLVLLLITIIMMLVTASFIFNSQIENLKKQIDKIYFGNFIPVTNLQNISSSYKDMIICLQNREKLCSIKKSQRIIQSNWNAYFKAYKTIQERKVVDSIDEDIKVSFMDKNSMKYTIMIQKINFLIEYEINNARKQRKEFLNRYENMKKLLFYNIVALVIFSFAIFIYLTYSIIKKDNHLTILNKKYKIESITDSMTMLYNRGYFDTIFDSIPVVSNSNKWQTAFIMFDIDFFKQYNDTYGHDMGDKTLKAVANELKKYFNKEYEYVFRLGGEEFGAILFDVDKEILENCLAAILKLVEFLKIEHKESKANKYVTVSIGAVIYEPGSNVSTNRLYKLADEKLYKSKQNGRNQYTI